MQAVIPGDDEGTRIGPLSASVPTPAVPVATRTLVAHATDAVASVAGTAATPRPVDRPVDPTGAGDRVRTGCRTFGDAREGAKPGSDTSLDPGGWLLAGATNPAAERVARDR